MYADQTADQSVTELKCPSKVNLGLRLVGREPSGLHQIQSLFLPVPFGDRLVVQSGPLGVQSAWEEAGPNDAALPREEDNLVYRFLSQLPAPLSQWTVKLYKRVPIGSGLGGGSSNVGTLARWLISRYPDRRDAISEIARGLGSDVAFFLDPVPQWVEGTGDKLAKWEEALPRWTLVLVFPPVSCSTPEMYDRFRTGGLEFSRAIAPPTDLDDYLKSCVNDLERVATDAPIPDILGLLKQTDPIYSGMSGSGSTCFAIFGQRQGAQNKLKALGNSIRSTQCKSVTLLM